MWTCPRCGSSVDPSYPSCWSCGTLREGTADPIVARADEPHTGEWACPKCGVSVDAGFEVCWSCGTSREGVEDPTFERADEADVAPYEPDPEDFTPSPDHDPIECLRCRGRMEEGFVADFRSPTDRYPIRWYPGKPEPSFWTGTWSSGEPIVVRTFRCVRCGYLESYANPEQ